ncbi:tryptophan--tRNA ligase [Candidatus Falkowbacteria bacterium CG10_big_fil_rev_8_21_14_0_10_39_11]|uniref:Tryptophan--tRNA ligase n=1 Tax=Candidatus Falkowbacteria bacterium CG10_big_fil_rev_8_21_14_0_10_39_11 TaxID=1974565 RepID=A0A2H0V459_9BACT|nr:MAG: tryptophan--tRNA ligase [Candidatus Falkowbacteria bacterium CG10_big_fil_rev_8_21_14_0_10_39_11]
MEKNVNILTGVRPTGSLTIANYLGAVKPLLELQNSGEEPLLFVADLHAITDYEPEQVKQYIRELVADYLALGVDPEKTTIYVQSVIKGQIMTLSAYLARLTTVAELLRVPTIKDKIKHGQSAESANALLFFYPVLMAADILIQRAKSIPVGEDQVAHLETTRVLAERFNKKYGEIFPIPKVTQVKSLRILSLKGDGKMSKSSPEGAIFLTDTLEEAEKKIKRAQTAGDKEMTPSLESLLLIVKMLDSTEEEQKRADDIIVRHKNGEQVMGEFKDLAIEIVKRFLTRFQTKRKEVLADPTYIDKVLEQGNDFARKNADETMVMVEKAMYGN